MIRFFHYALVLLSFALATAAAAQVTSVGIDEFAAPADARWKGITRNDVEAAFRFILENHPAAARSLDPKFKAVLDRARSRALERADKAISYDGYAATLAGFATDLGDKHIWSRPTYVRSLVRWPGLVVGIRGASWIVTDADGDPARHSLIGAQLVACDGEPVDTIAARNLGGFRANWNIGAQRVQKAPWFFVDEANPFFARPKVCQFEVLGSMRTVELQWLRVKREELLPRLLKAAGAGAAGFSVQRLGNGYWIGLQDLDGPAAEVARQVEAKRDQLRAADFVVLDLRGNGGGSSTFGREIADSLLGSAFVNARLGPTDAPQCGNPDGTWRASPGNYSNIAYLLQTKATSLPPEAIAMLKAELERMREALKKKAEFTGPTSCVTKSGQPELATAPLSLLSGRLVLITDNVCFSACLSTTDDFRRLGALHLGQTTDAATHYVEVRESYLPSGYSLFSTLQAIDPASQYQVGPFDPEILYPGDIAATGELKAWVLNLLAAPGRPSSRETPTSNVHWSLGQPETKSVRAW